MYWAVWASYPPLQHSTDNTQLTQIPTPHSRYASAYLTCITDKFASNQYNIVVYCILSKYVTILGPCNYFNWRIIIMTFDFCWLIFKKWHFVIHSLAQEITQWLIMNVFLSISLLATYWYVWISRDVWMNASDISF